MDVEELLQVSANKFAIVKPTLWMVSDISDNVEEFEKE